MTFGEGRCVAQVVEALDCWWYLAAVMASLGAGVASTVVVVVMIVLYSGHGVTRGRRGAGAVAGGDCCAWK